MPLSLALRFIEAVAHDLLVFVLQALAGFVPEGDFDVIADFAEQLEVVLILRQREEQAQAHRRGEAVGLHLHAGLGLDFDQPQRPRDFKLFAHFADADA